MKFTIRLLLIFSITTVITLAGACGGKSHAAGEIGVDTVLPLPNVPDSLRDPTARASYAVIHFWDAMDFSRDSRVADSLFFERTFSNYVTLLSLASDDAVDSSVSSMLSDASRNPETLENMLALAEEYLDGDDSPYRNTEIWMVFARYGLKSEKISGPTRENLEYKLSEAMKNRPGTRAGNIRILLRDGSESTLYRSLEGNRNIVFFYDSDCPHCEETASGLAMADFGPDTRILAIDVARDRKMWDDRKYLLSPSWTVGYDLDGVMDSEKYVFSSLPSIYLLDSDGTVLLRDTDPGRILAL